MDNFLNKLLNMRSTKIAGLLIFFNSIGAYQIYKTHNNNDMVSLKISFSRQISKRTGQLAQMNIPIFLRNPLFQIYGNLFNVDFDDMLEQNLQNYGSFQEFFTRKVKDRQFSKEEQKLIVPADSRVLSFTEITGNETLLVKQRNYKLGYFLTGRDNFVFDSNTLQTLKKRQDTKLYSIIFYLAPGDYHRYHCPTDFAIQSRNHMIGHLAPVKISHVESTPNVYETNERVALFGRYPFGFMSIVMVGALNVGSMTLNYDPTFCTNTNDFQREFITTYYEKDKRIQLTKGEEFGMFKFGSTVVMIFEAKEINWLVKEGDKCRWGQIFAEVK